MFLIHAIKHEAEKRFISLAFEAFKNLGIKVGAQDCHYKANGAYTGDVSSKMIRELGSSYIIIGHSERRDNYQSEDLHIFEKVKRTIDENLIPIICIGENLADRQNNDTEAVLKNQLNFLSDHKLIQNFISGHILTQNFISSLKFSQIILDILREFMA